MSARRLGGCGVRVIVTMLTALGLCGVSEGQVVEVGQRVLYTHATNAYSIERYGGRVWLGVYTQPWDDIQEFGSGGACRVVLAEEGYFINDPSVTYAPRIVNGEFVFLDGEPVDGELWMLYARAPADGINRQSIARSFDGGATWAPWRHEVLVDVGSVSVLTAWDRVHVWGTPMALTEPGTGKPTQAGRWVMWRSGDGVVVSPSEPLRLPDGQFWEIGNIDVAWAPSASGYTYVAVGNRYLGEVFLAFSHDGATWTWPQRLIASAWLHTAPHVTVLNDGYLTVAYSVSEDGTTGGHHRTEERMYRLAGVSGVAPAWPTAGSCDGMPPPPPPEPPPSGGGGLTPPSGGCWPWQEGVVIGGVLYCL